MPDTALQLLITDPRQSVLMRSGASRFTPFMPFGYSPEQCRPVGYGGLHLEPEGVFLLGNGYRGYSPTLLRFTRPDDWSPFGAGGTNAYAYCGGEPISSTDTDGHLSRSYILKWLRTFMGSSLPDLRAPLHRVPRLRAQSLPDLRATLLPSASTSVKSNARSMRYASNSSLSKDSDDSYPVHYIQGRRIVGTKREVFV